MQHRNCNQFTKRKWMSGLTTAILCLMWPAGQPILHKYLNAVGVALQLYFR